MSDTLYYVSDMLCAFAALWRSFSDHRGAAVTTRRKQPAAVEHVESQRADIHVCGTHRRRA